MIFTLLTLSFIHAQQEIFTVYDTTNLRKAKTLRVISFDTLPSFYNHKVKRNQKDYIDILMHDFYHGIHESSSYEVLDSNSSEQADIELFFKFKRLYVYQDSKSKDSDTISFAELELKGIQAETEKVLFNLVSSDPSYHDVKEDELLDNMKEALDDFDSFFDRHSKSERIKSFQFYKNMNCESFDSLQYVFLRNRENQNENLLSNLIVHDFQVVIDEEKYNIKKVSSSDINYLIKKEDVKFYKNQNLITPKLQQRLIKRGITELLIFHNLKFLAPQSKTLISGFSISPGMFTLTIGFNADKADDIICDIYILDVVENKCLLRTKLFGNNPQDIGNEALDAIGEMDIKKVRIKKCFD